MAQEPPASTLVLALCGLPGVGKSTLAARLAQHGQAVTAGALEVVHICFDDYGCAQTSDEFSPDAWKRGRQAALAALEAALQRAGAAQQADVAGRQCLVIADDNHHLRSMRCESYTLARKHGAAFAQLHVLCSAGLAQERNAARPSAAQVPPDVIRRMAAAFEAPGSPGALPWDRQAVVVDAAEDADGGSTSDKLAGIWHLIMDAWGPPAPPLLDHEAAAAAKAAAQQATAASLVHAVDLACRQAVAEILQRHLTEAPAEQRADAARRLNACKQRLLAELRQQQQQQAEMGSVGLAEPMQHWAAVFWQRAACCLPETFQAGGTSR